MAEAKNVTVNIERKEKPPIGVAPHWFVYPNRIADLSGAILRYTKFGVENHTIRNTKEDYKMIAQWASEISTLAKLMCELEK